jgi:hypothetical protein
VDTSKVNSIDLRAALGIPAAYDFNVTSSNGAVSAGNTAGSQGQDFFSVTRKAITNDGWISKGDFENKFATEPNKATEITVRVWRT